MTDQEIDKWVEEHIVAPPEGSKHKSAAIEWGKIVAHKFFMKGVEEGRRLEREEREENKRKEDELPRFYGD